MPILSQFYGITIKMYFQQSEHNPPHIHVAYAGSVAEFSIRTGRILEGKLPPKETTMVKTWIRLHRNELLEIWETQHFVKIAPYKRKD